MGNYKHAHELLVKMGPVWYPGAWFRLPSEEKVLYLTFDDGPTPGVTSTVLDILQAWNAKATFFVIGKNALAHPELLTRIQALGHSLGGHCMQHENGWRTDDGSYLNSATRSLDVLPNTKLFRPPYGRIRRRQHLALKEQGIQTVLWDVLSYDFDTTLSAQDCINWTRSRVRQGSIVVFHDSHKAAPRMEQALQSLLAVWTEEGYRFEHLPKA